MYNFIIGLLNNLIKGIALIINSIMNILPNSPFSNLNYENINYNEFLSWVNTFIPLSSMVSHFAAFISILGTYYLYQIVMRWIKVIGE